MTIAESFVHAIRRGENPSISSVAKRCPSLKSEIHREFPTLLLAESLKKVAQKADDSNVPIQGLASIESIKNSGKAAWALSTRVSMKARTRKSLSKSCRSAGLATGRY